VEEGVGDLMKLLFAGIAGVMAVSASAQTRVVGESMNSPNYTTWQSSVESLNGLGSETPSMRARKLARARALTTEAKTLLQQDGGKFTPEHEAYIRGKACDVLGHKRVEIGSLVPRSRCS
jgi:hypothetical protein